MGVAGSGKTTLSRGILRRIWAVYLDNNQIADAFFPNTRMGADYEKLRPRLYKALYMIAEENLKVGNNVLMDVPHIKEIQRPRWRFFIKKLVAKTKAKLIIIRCVCPENVLRARISERGELRDGWKLKHWKQFLAQEPIHVAIPFRHLDIDTEQNLTRNTATALRYIRKIIDD